jgi:outer membrane protein assembly factor BamB
MIQPMTKACAVVLAGLICCLTANASGDFDARFEQIEQLQQVGHHLQALEALDDIEADLPLSERAAAWRIDYGYDRVHAAYFGKHVGYLLGPRGSGVADNNGDQLHQVAESPDDPKHKSQGFGPRYITCIDLETGDVRWTARAFKDAQHGIHPEHDTLWTWAKSEGAAIGYFGPDEPTFNFIANSNGYPEEELLLGIQINDIVIWDQLETRQARKHSGDWESGVIDIKTNKKILLPKPPSRQGDTWRYAAYKPYSGNRGAKVTSIQVFSEPIKPESWELFTAGQLQNPPAWFDGDLLLLAGSEDASGEIRRHNGLTGKLRWESHLPELLASPHGFLSKVRNFSFDGYWIAGVVQDDKLWVFGQSGTLYQLDWATGRIEYNYPTPITPIGPPHLTDSGIIILPGVNQTLAIPRQRLTERLTADDPAIRLLRLRMDSLNKLGRRGAAQRAAAAVTLEAPAEPEGWQAYSDQLNHVRCWKAAMSAQGTAFWVSDKRFDQAIYDEVGLVDRMPLGPSEIKPLQVGPLLYLATSAGRVVKLHPPSQVVIQDEQLPAGIFGLNWIEGRLFAQLHPGLTHLLAESPLYQPIRRPLPMSLQNNPSWLEPRQQHFTADEPIFHQRKIFRPAGNGQVIHYDRSTSQIQKPDAVLPEVVSFRLTQTPLGYLAHGTGGIYKVDPQTLLPVETLIDPSQPVESRRPANRPCLVTHVASDEDSLAFVVRDLSEHRLEIWRLNPLEQVRTTRIQSSTDRDMDRDRLRALAGGYLWVGGELLYQSKNLDQPRRLLEITNLFEWDRDRSYRRWPRFSPPVDLPGDRIGATHTHGGFWVFDLKQMTRPHIAD